MNTLSISQIFSHFSLYQKNYLSIIQDAEQYFTPVTEAFIELWPAGRHQLYLGDLLQLWLSEKWLIEKTHSSILDTLSATPQQIHQLKKDQYIYQITGSNLSGRNQAKVWSASQQDVASVSLDSAFKFYCIYKGMTRPQKHHINSGKFLKSAI